MRRLIVVGLLLGSGLSGGAHPAWAIDYDEPVIAAQFLMAPPAPAAPGEAAGLRLQVLRRESAELTGTGESPSSGAATPAAAPVRACAGWGGDNGGRALWDWNTC